LNRFSLMYSAAWFNISWISWQLAAATTTGQSVHCVIESYILHVYNIAVIELT